MFIADLIKQIVDKIEEEKMEECDTCGQISRLKCGLCEWCRKIHGEESEQ